MSEQEAGRSAEKDVPAEFPSSWVIEVCRTCGCVAQWPFCEHREQRPADGRSWCLPVVVKGNLPAKHRIIPPAPTHAAREDRAAMSIDPEPPGAALRPFTPSEAEALDAQPAPAHADEEGEG